MRIINKQELLQLPAGSIVQKLKIDSTIAAGEGNYSLGLYSDISVITSTYPEQGNAYAFELFANSKNDCDKITLSNGIMRYVDFSDDEDTRWLLYERKDLEMIFTVIGISIKECFIDLETLNYEESLPSAIEDHYSEKYGVRLKLHGFSPDPAPLEKGQVVIDKDRKTYCVGDGSTMYKDLEKKPLPKTTGGSYIHDVLRAVDTGPYKQGEPGVARESIIVDPVTGENNVS